MSRCLRFTWIFATLFILAIASSACRSENPEIGFEANPHSQRAFPWHDLHASCPSHMGSDCIQALEIIEDLTNARREAKSRGDTEAFERASLELNYRNEWLTIAEAGGGPDEFAALERKYEIIEQAYLADLEERTASTENRERDTSPLIYHPSELQATKQVFNDFGELFVEVTDADINDGYIKYSSEKVPWSGYWYPTSQDALFRGNDAPFVKFDQLTKRLGRTGQAARWEEDHFSGIPSYGWEGFCDAWAKAAIIEPEPTVAVRYHGVVFKVTDLKALLTKAHEFYPVKTYGVRYNGDAVTDGTYQDVRPEAFHNIVMNVIGRRKKAIVVDYDAGVEVWSKPLFRVDVAITADPERDHALRVDAFAWHVNHRREETDEPTGRGDYLLMNYQYRLYVDKQTQWNGAYRVVAGEWIGPSFERHPDTISLLHLGGALGSNNDEFHKNIDLVREILTRGIPVETD